ncbi:MAG: hypothetical protein IKW50_04590 [Oscillospiraceae bacterium]|nr:hypothetical protein [Oscillospiraceae bacterium]
MKIIGYVLIILQVIAVIGGGIPSAPGGAAYSLSYMLGFFLPGIIGVILVARAPKHSAKRQQQEANDFEAKVRASGLTAFEYVKTQLSPSILEFCENNAHDIPKLQTYLNHLQTSGTISERDAAILLQGYTASNR